MIEFDYIMTARFVYYKLLYIKATSKMSYTTITRAYYRHINTSKNRFPFILLTPQRDSKVKKYRNRNRNSNLIVQPVYATRFCVLMSWEVWTAFDINNASPKKQFVTNDKQLAMFATGRRLTSQNHHNYPMCNITMVSTTYLMYAINT